MKYKVTSNFSTEHSQYMILPCIIFRGPENPTDGILTVDIDFGWFCWWFSVCIWKML
jgi:hypothetical protein